MIGAEDHARSDPMLVKELVLAWSGSVKSFETTYTIHSVRIEDGKELFHRFSRIEYRRAGDNFYFREDSFDEYGVFQDGITFAYADGAGEFLQNYPSGDASGRTNLGKIPFPYFPWGAYVTPEEILGEDMGRPLREMLATGNSYLKEAGGHLVFVHDNPVLGKSVAVHFDNGMNVTRLDWFKRPYDLTEEERNTLWSGDPEELRLLLVSLVFDDLAEMHGVVFPLTVRKSWWNSDQSLKERTIRRRDSGEISQAEFLVETYSRPQFEAAYQIFEMEQVRLNPPMTAADFRIKWPENVQILEEGSDGTLVPEPLSGASDEPRWRSLWRYCIPRIKDVSVYGVSVTLGGLAVVLAMAALALRWVRRRGR